MRHGRTRGFQRGAGGWLAILLALLLSAFLVWQIVRATVSNALTRRNPVAAAVVAPDNPRVAFELAMLEFTAAGGAIRPETRERALKAMASAPLAYEPFFIAAVDALTRRDEANAQKLLLEARHRNPRSRYARLLLLDGYLRAGKVDDATIEMGALLNLIPEAGGVLTGELARLARTPATEAPLTQALKRHPGPRNHVLENLAQSGADPDLILRIARAVPPPPGGQAGGEWQVKLIASLVARGEVDRAYGMWREFSSPRAPTRATGLYDPDMRGLPGLAPFNWTFPTSAAGAADRSPTGLQVEYYGRDGGDLASQLLMLAPGRYRLAFVAEGSADGAGSRLAWTVTCLQSKEGVAEIALRNVDSSPRRIAGEFAIPAQGCSAQWLKLVGTPSEFAKGQSATIRNLQLSPAGR